MSISKVYEIITDRIISLLESGTVPWRKPWAQGEPLNLISKRPYRGVNVFMLGCAPYASPYFMTFNQAKQLGGKVRKGEKGWPVIFWKRIPIEDDEQKKKMIPLLRYYTVFNAEQVEGIEIPLPPGDTEHSDPIFECEGVRMCYPNPPRISEESTKAFYRPSEDLVCLPPKSRFKQQEEYYCTLFHELVHSTGHDTRLARKGITDKIMFGTHQYSKEELIAEMGAAFLCAESGIIPQTIENSAAYIKGWLSALKGDARLVVDAAAGAQRAADLILDRKFEQEEIEE